MKILIFLFFFSITIFAQSKDKIVVLTIPKDSLSDDQTTQLLYDIHNLELKYKVKIQAQYQITESRDSINGRVWIDKINYIQLKIGGTNAGQK